MLEVLNLNLPPPLCSIRTELDCYPSAICFMKFNFETALFLNMQIQTYRHTYINTCKDLSRYAVIRLISERFGRSSESSLSLQEGQIENIRYSALDSTYYERITVYVSISISMKSKVRKFCILILDIDHREEDALFQRENSEN